MKEEKRIEVRVSRKSAKTTPITNFELRLHTPGASRDASRLRPSRPNNCALSSLRPKSKTSRPLGRSIFAISSPLGPFMAFGHGLSPCHHRTFRRPTYNRPRPFPPIRLHPVQHTSLPPVSAVASASFSFDFPALSCHTSASASQIYRHSGLGLLSRSLSASSRSPVLTSDLPVRPHRARPLRPRPF